MRRFKIAGGILVLLAVLAVISRSSDIRQAIVAGASGCKDCLPGPDVTVLGGIVGGVMDTASTGNGTPFAQAAQTVGRSPTLTSAWITNPTWCIQAAAPAGAWGSAWIQKSDFGSTAALTMPVSTPIIDGAAAGCHGLPNSYNQVVQGEFVEPIFDQNNFTAANAATWAWGVYGVRVQPFQAFYNAAVAASTTVFSAPGQGTTAGVTTTDEELVEIPMPAGSVTRLSVVNTTAQPASGALVVTVRNNAVDTSTTKTILASGAAGFRTNATSTAFAAGDRLSWSLANAATAGSGAINNVALEFVPDSGVNGVLIFPFGNRTFTASTTHYLYPFANLGHETAVGSAIGGAPRAFTLQNGRCWVKTAPANNVVFTVYRAGVVTSITGTLTSGFAAPGVFSLAGSAEAWAQFQSYTLEVVTLAGAQTVIGGCSFEVI